MPCWVGSFTPSVISGICCSVVCSDITLGAVHWAFGNPFAVIIYQVYWGVRAGHYRVRAGPYIAVAVSPIDGHSIYIYCGTPYHLGYGESTQWMPAQECRDTLSVHLGCGDSTQWMPAQECRDTLSDHLGCGESTHGMPAQECRDTLSVHLGCGESTQGMPAQECRDTPPGLCKAIFVTCNPGLRL